MNRDHDQVENSCIKRYEPLADMPIPPDKKEYKCDVLVIGGGFAGLMAALEAAEKGCSVVLADKGMPGYSGLSPFVSDTRWFDAEMGDNKDLYMEYNMRASQFMGNMNWYETWCEESKSVYEKYCELGLCDQYESAKEAGFSERDDYSGYARYVKASDRHHKFMKALREKNVTVVPHTMIHDVLTDNGTVCGAVGFHVPSAAPVVFHAGAVVMCMGGGVYKSAGWPTGGISYDGISIGYRLGLPIIGQEFEDFHKTRADAPGNAARIHGYVYLQNLFFEGGDLSEESLKRAGSERCNLYVNNVISAYNGQPAWKPADTKIRFGNHAKHEEGDIRGAKDPFGGNQPGRVTGDCGGAAPGFGMHLTNGIFCGCEDTDGYTGIPGLYCAGDGCNAGPVGGATYAGRMGFTSNFSGLQGKRAGNAAAEHARKTEIKEADPELITEKISLMKKPLNTSKGYSPEWALDALHGIMAPMWTSMLKTEECLSAALTQVIFMRDRIAPKLQAVDGHGLRTCIEVQNKILEAEMKLRLSLARKESRGGHYRMDHPRRNDKEFLCYLAAVKGADGDMEIKRFDYPDEWKGDLTETYEQRYGGGLSFPLENGAEGGR